jgi:hypothetical protein
VGGRGRNPAVERASSPDGTLYAATSSGVELSDDAGERWRPSRAHQGLGAAAPPVGRRVLVSAHAPEMVFAAGTQGLWKSTRGDLSTRLEPGISFPWPATAVLDSHRGTRQPEDEVNLVAKRYSGSF